MNETHPDVMEALVAYFSTLLERYDYLRLETHGHAQTLYSDIGIRSIEELKTELSDVFGSIQLWASIRLTTPKGLCLWSMEMADVEGRYVDC